MPEKVMPGPVEDQRGIREAVCIHTRKIYDSCRDKDCIEDLRFYPKLPCVDVINRALSVKGGSAKLLYVYVDVEPVSFKPGCCTSMWTWSPSASTGGSTRWICGSSTT